MPRPFCLLSQLRCEFYIIAVFPGADGTSVPLSDAAGYGEPYTEAAVRGIAGAVGPVKPVKKLVQVAIRETFTEIACPQSYAAAALFKRQVNDGVWGGILDGVVKQNGHELPHGVLVAPVFKLRLDITVQLMPPGEGVIPEGLRRFRYALADVEILKPEGRLLLVHTG